MFKNLTASVLSILKLLAIYFELEFHYCCLWFELIITHRTSTSFNNNHVTQHLFYLQDIRRILDDLHLQKYQVNMAVNCSHQELHSQNQLA